MHKKCSNEVILSSYAKHGNIWKVAEEVGVCGQSVWERLKRLGVDCSIKKWTEQEINILNDFYVEHKNKPIDLSILSKKLCRKIPTICAKAGQLGLTIQNRPLSEDEKSNLKEKTQEQWKKNEHPRGMIGKHHDDETKKIMSNCSLKTWNKMTDKKKKERNSKISETRFKHIKEGMIVVHENTYSNRKHGRRADLGNQFFRSSWEANYARYLNFLASQKKILKFEYEPETFWFENIKRGVRSFLPDFKVWINNDVFEYHEVKGWMDPKSKTKIRRMRKYHPLIKLIVIDSSRYKAISKTAGWLPNWEK